MTYHVIIQPQAEAEIEAAYLWKRDNAPQAAARWFAGIVEASSSHRGAGLWPALKSYQGWPEARPTRL